MQFVIDVIVSILTAYLAFTNLLAEKITQLLPEEPVEEEIIEIEEEPVEEAFLPSLPSAFGTSIPDILLRSLDYQKAAAIEGLESTYVTEPIEAIVNIFCTFTTPTTIRTTTGTGFFVHSDGVILTNAHVAQFLLLETTDLLGEADCLIRKGNPAEPEYRAELLYIPPTWVQKNAALIDSKAPTGTGERDYALLYITESLDKKNPLPAKFPALAINSDFLPRSIKDVEVSAAGYPAGALLKNGPNSPLTPVVATTSVSELYTFGSNYADVFSIRGSKVGEEGSSGGPVVDERGLVIGMIVTKGDDQSDGPGSLRAISMSHVHRTILEETGFTLDKNIGGDIPRRAGVFTKTLAPFLINLLSLELEN
jgi:S1-C subfamily serine protease